jgi:hypothetical protein
MSDIVNLKKLKYIPGPGIALAIQVVPCEENKDFIKRTITFFPEEVALVTEREAEYLLNIQKSHKFVEIMEE